MELSPGQQRGLFVVIVVVLAGLGAFLIGTGGHHAASGAPAPSASATPAGGAQAPVASGAAPPSVEPGTTTVPPPAGTTSAKGQANIYN